MSTMMTAVQSSRSASFARSAVETAVLDFQPSRAVPRRMVISWNRRTVAVSIFVRRCEDSVVYTSVPHEDALLDVVGAEMPTYQLWLGATMFEVSFREYEVLRERLAPLGLRFRGGTVMIFRRLWRWLFGPELLPPPHHTAVSPRVRDDWHVDDSGHARAP